jgi:hypothetical protein
MSPQLSKICVKPIDDQNATKMVKDMELQKLHGTIKALQRVVTDTGVVLEQERLDFNSSLQDARKQIEILKLKEILDSDASDGNYDRIMKDIQLDLVQTPSRRAASYRYRKKTSATHSDDKMLALWSVGRVSSGSHRNDVDQRLPQSEAPVTDRMKKRCSSESVVMKDLSVDKQELVQKSVAMTEPHREWKKKVIDRLSSEAQRLSDLRSIIQVLQSSVESTADTELEDVKAQMVDAEDTVAELIDANGKLLKKAEEFTSAADGDVDLRSRSQRKILERVRKISEKAGRLELELQRFQHALLKHEEERVARRAAKATTVQVQRRSRVQLVEYLYGRRRENRRPKQKQRGPSCCLRAKTIDD